MANSRGGGSEAAGARSTDPVAEVVLEAIASDPGMHRADLVQRVRERTGVPVATAITRIRRLEREGALAREENERGGDAPMPDDGDGPEDAVDSPEAETQGAGGELDRDLHEDEAAAGPTTEAALSAYRELREPAVSAYCECIAPAEDLSTAIEACFASLADAVGASGLAEGSDPDEVLLRAARWAAAERAIHPQEIAAVADTGARRLLASVREAARPAACDVMPHIVLAVRAAGLLPEPQAHLVRRHIDGCARCGAVESRQWRAEGAFHQLVLEAPLDPTIRTALERV